MSTANWIKLEKDLQTDPRFLRMVKAFSTGDVTQVRYSPAMVVTLLLGCLARLWMYADTHLRDDDTLDMGAHEIDELVGVAGFCDLLPTDWFQVLDPHSVKLPDFQQHNGTEAKKRALSNKRVAKYRAQIVTQQRYVVADPCNAGALPDQTRPDQKRPDQTRPKKDTAQALPAPPDGLNREAWKLWLAYRVQIRRPLKPASIPAAQRQLAAFGSDQAQVVEQSIANGWQGLFELKGANGTATGKPFVKWKTTAELEAEEAARAQH